MRHGRRDVPARFLAAGAINTAIGLSMYPLLLLSFPVLQRHYLLALAIAQALCLCVAFSTYKFGVFRTRGNVASEFGSFSAFYLVNYAANWMALPFFVEVMRVPPIFAQLGFTIALIVGSWFWHTRVTFRQRSH